MINSYFKKIYYYFKVFFFWRQKYLVVIRHIDHAAIKCFDSHCWAPLWDFRISQILSPAKLAGFDQFCHKGVWRKTAFPKHPATVGLFMFYISPQLERTGTNSLEKNQNPWTSLVLILKKKICAGVFFVHDPSGHAMVSCTKSFVVISNPDSSFRSFVGYFW